MGKPHECPPRKLARMAGEPIVRLNVFAILRAALLPLILAAGLQPQHALALDAKKRHIESEKIWGTFESPAVSPQAHAAASFADLSESAVASRPRATIEERYQPVLALDGGSRLTIIAPARWSNLGEEVRTLLIQTHRRYGQFFGTIPALRTGVQLMDDETFYLSTGAPRWTNALYYRGQIIIPLSDETANDRDNLYRSIKHEYTHAVIHALSGGRCPGWLDEGLAQWAEGSENPALEPALANWLEVHPALPFALLQNGFTKLAQQMVPAAYGQSLFATKAILKNYSFHEVADFLTRLRAGEDRSRSFSASFGVSEGVFEKQIASDLRVWAARYSARQRR